MDLSLLQQRFGAVVRRRRLAAKIGQEAFAEKAGLHRTHVSSLERGRQMPSLAVVAKVAAALDTTMTDLIREMEAEENPLAAEPPPLPRGRPSRASEK